MCKSRKVIEEAENLDFAGFMEKVTLSAGYADCFILGFIIYSVCRSFALSELSSSDWVSLGVLNDDKLPVAGG